MFYLADGRKQLYQWDLDRKIICSDASIIEVHFYLTANTTLKVERKYDDNIGDYFDIPNILLQNTSPIRLYGCEEGYTKIVYQFPVIGRPKPADYVYTETEVKRWEDYVAQVTEMEAEIEAIKERIEELHTEYAWVDFRPYIYALDEESADILYKNAVKYQITGSPYRAVEHREIVSSLDDEFWNYVSFSFDFEPDSRGSGYGNITSVSAILPDGYTLKSVEATRGYFRYGIYLEDGMAGYDFATNFTIIFTDSAGKEYAEEHYYRFWGEPPDWDDYLYVINVKVPRNSETEQFFTETASTYDMRTQSIDRQLVALVEESKARRKTSTNKV